jgi:hypothetical protein
MNCQKFETVANEVARGRMMEAELRSDALAHSADCESCASLFRDEEVLTQGLQSLSKEMISLEAPAAVEDRLISAFRQRQVVVPMPVARTYRRYWLTAVAALFLVVIGLVAFNWKTDPAVAPSTPQQAVGPTPNQKEVIAKDEVQPQPKEEDFEVGPAPKPTRRPVLKNLLAQSRTPRAKNSDQVSNHAEVATDFMPIGYMNAATFQDGGQIIRVEVPRSRLASFGLPVNMDRYNERVKADILISNDGMARAIRFVQDKRLD